MNTQQTGEEVEVPWDLGVLALNMISINSRSTRVARFSSHGRRQG